MVKSELISTLVAQHPHLPKADVVEMVERVFELISDSLSEGERVEVRGLGTFHLGARASRRMVDPRNGQERSLPSRKTVLFKPGAWFKNGDGSDDN